MKSTAPWFALIITASVLVSGLVSGCATPDLDDSRPAGESKQSPELSQYLLFGEEQAQQALASIGVDREVVSAMFLPMAIDRLGVEVQSLSAAVPNLRVTFWNPGNGWELEKPVREKIDVWLVKSARR